MNNFTFTLTSPTLDREEMAALVTDLIGKDIVIGQIVGKITFAGTEPGGLYIRGESIDRLFGKGKHEHA